MALIGAAATPGHAADVAAPQITSIASPFRAAPPRNDGLPIVPLQVDANAMESLRRHDPRAPVRLTDFVVVAADPAVQSHENLSLDLQRFEIFTEDAKIVDGSDRTVHEFGRPLPLPDVMLFRGTVRDRADSQVFLSLSPHGVHGYVQTPERLQIISNGNMGAAGAQRELVIFDATALPEGVIHWRDFVCAAADPQGGVQRPEGGIAGSADAPLCSQVVFAVETDYEFTNNLFGGSSSTASAYVATLLGAVSGIYTSHFNVHFTIDFVRLWTSSNDPWTESGTSAQLGQFRDTWNETMMGVDRHLAHFLSGRSLGGGVAWLSALCSSDLGYGLSANLNGFFPYPIEDYSSQNWDAYVVAHEIGHNFGAPHTHAYCPPLDSCSSSFGPCQSQSICQQGTIMSYCHTCPGGVSNIALNFHPGNVETILDFLASLPNGPCPAVADDCMPTPWNVKATPAAICAGSSSLLSATAPPGHGIKWYAVGCGEALVGSGTSVEVMPEDDTTYFARLFDNDTGEEIGTCAAAAVSIMYDDGVLWPTIGQQGMDSVVLAMTVWNGDVIAGGDFTYADGEFVNHVARWNGSGWSRLGSAFSPGTNGTVQALTTWNNHLYVGGEFTVAGTQNATGIARRTASAWQSVGTGGSQGVNGSVDALSTWNGHLIVGGSFELAGGVLVNHIARWTGSAWQSFTAPGGNGTNGTVRAITTWNDDLVIGGDFTTAGGQTVNYIARWDGSEWHPFTTPGGVGLSSSVHALTTWNGDLVAGGYFVTAGGQTVNRVARWDGTTWHPFSVGTSIGVGGAVKSLTTWIGDLIVGGYFVMVGGEEMNRVARWSGSNWHPLGINDLTGVDGSASPRVAALMTWNEDLLTGGSFTVSVGQQVNHIAQWHYCGPDPDPECAVADLDCNGLVDGNDLSILLGQWGPCTDCVADLDDNGIVDGADLALVLGQWAP